MRRNVIYMDRYIPKGIIYKPSEVRPPACMFAGVKSTDARGVGTREERTYTCVHGITVTWEQARAAIGMTK